jgi:hypothetical protein
MSRSSDQVQHWGVDVRVNGETILTIESNCLSGKSNLTDAEDDMIRLAANHLLSFAGKSKKGDLATAATDLLDALRELHDFACPLVASRNHERSCEAFNRAAELLGRLE